MNNSVLGVIIQGRVLDKTYSKKHVIFDVPMTHSSRLEHWVICLSTLKLEAAGTSETSSPTCQTCYSVFQKTDILNSLQGDEGKIQLKILETLSFNIHVIAFLFNSFWRRNFIRSRCTGVTPSSV